MVKVSSIQNFPNDCFAKESYRDVNNLVLGEIGNVKILIKYNELPRSISLVIWNIFIISLNENFCKIVWNIFC